MVGLAVAIATVVIALATLAVYRYKLQRDCDKLIDELIARNRARSRPGMEQADWRLIDRAGAKRWAEVEWAQEQAAAGVNRLTGGGDDGEKASSGDGEWDGGAAGQGTRIRIH